MLGNDEGDDENKEQIKETPKPQQASRPGKMFPGWQTVN